jgi:hypothetical protein
MPCQCDKVGRNLETAVKRLLNSRARIGEAMKFLYFLDCYSDGGAELGLATLVENRVVANHEVSIWAVTGNKLS